jgi:hypothetical protein
MTSVKRWLLCAFGIALYVMAMAPGVGAEGAINAQAELDKMAEEYWTKRLIDRDYAFTYEKELEKDAIPFSEYVEKVKLGEKFTYKSVKTSRVEIEGDRGAVFLTVEVIGPPFSRSTKQMLQDLWLHRSGQWVHKFTEK